ncbi:MAG: M20/M25/M40 family metallo-hydrolase [Planctomycetota bacterium]
MLPFVRLAPIVPGFALLLAAPGCQQPTGDHLDRWLIGEVTMRSAFAANLRTLAMPGGRLTGTPNAERAQEFIADELRAYGLRNVHAEPFDMTCWTVRETRVTVLDDPPRELTGAVALAMTLGTPPEGVTAELVDLGSGTDEEIKAGAEPLRGRFALVRDVRHERGAIVRKAIEHGAAGVVFTSPAERAPIIGNGHREPRPEPVVVVPHDEKLLAQVAAGPVRINIRLDAEAWPCRPCNIVGEIPGRGPLAREVVILTAHLDSWHLAEGGMDNGSGSAAILEAARALAALAERDWRPRRTLRFIWFMSEEIGLNGSRAYVREHSAELDRVIAVINADMPGAPRRLVAFGHPEVQPWLERVRADLAAYELDLKIAEAKGMWSDHAPFMQQGVCTLAVGGELGPGAQHYHTTGDTYETVDRRGTVQSSAVFAVMLRRLADEPRRPTQRLAAQEPDEH